MKKLLFSLIATSIFTFSLFSCQTTKTAAEPESDYTQEEVQTVQQEISTEEEIIPEITDESEEYDASDEYTDEYENEYYQSVEIEPGYTKQQKKALISFGNIDKFVLTEDFSLFNPNALYKFKQRPATITIDPKAKQLGFGSQYLLAYYIVLFDTNGMEKYQNALNNYLSDFDNKKLDRKSKKTWRKYGYTTGKMWWGSIKTSTPNYNKPNIYFGYEFYENKPYFSITIPATVNDFFLEKSSKADKESMALKYHFTKAQASELAKYMTPEYLSTYVDTYQMNLTGGELQTGDDY